MRFLLDTNVLSEARRASPEPRVAAWLAARPSVDLAISVITVMELQIGVRRVQRKDPEQGHRLDEWLRTRVLPGFAGRVLDVDLDVALRCADLHVPDPSSERDALIAATALVHGLSVVTRNVAHFDSSGAHVVNPWDDEPAH